MKNLLISLLVLFPTWILAQQGEYRYIITGKITDASESKEFFPTISQTSNQDSCLIYVEEKKGNKKTSNSVRLLIEQNDDSSYICTVITNRNSQNTIASYLHFKVVGYSEISVALVQTPDEVKQGTLDIGDIKLLEQKSIVKLKPSNSSANSTEPEVNKEKHYPEIKINLIVKDPKFHIPMETVELRYPGSTKDSIIQFDSDGNIFFKIESQPSDSTKDLIPLNIYQKGFYGYSKLYYLSIDKQKWREGMDYTHTIWMKRVEFIPQKLTGQILLDDINEPVDSALIEANWNLERLGNYITDTNGNFDFDIDTSRYVALLDSIANNGKENITFTITRKGKPTVSQIKEFPYTENRLTVFLNNDKFIRGRVLSEINNKPLKDIKIRATFVKPEYLGKIDITTDELGFFSFGFGLTEEPIITNLIISDHDGIYEEQTIDSLIVNNKDLENIILKRKCNFQNLPFHATCNLEKPDYKSYKYVAYESSGLALGIVGSIILYVNYNRLYDRYKCDRPPSSFYEDECKKTKTTTILAGIGVGILSGYLLTARYFPQKRKSKKSLSFSLDPSLNMIKSEDLSIPVLSFSYNF